MAGDGMAGGWPMEGQVDIAVLGAGPAGCVAALGLAELGHRVAMIHTPRPFIAWEGVSDRALEGLSRIGCTRALAAIGPEVRRQAHWGGIAAAANRERIVERAPFDAALLEDVGAAGIAIHRGRVGRLDLRPGAVRVVWRGSGGTAAALSAKLAIEARGRRAPRLGAQVEAAPGTTALIAEWQLPASAPAMTAVAPFANGWAWFAGDGQGRAALQIVIDAASGGLSPRRGLADLYRRLINDIPETRAWLAGARGMGRVSARNATMRLLAPAASRALLRIGDAGAAIDPLSGQGLFEATGSALAAVAVANTILRRPQATDLALAFFNDRATLTFRHQAAVACAFYAQETRWADRPFWRARASWPVTPSARDEAAKAARIECRPVIQDGFIVERPVVVSAVHPRGVWRVAGVPVVDLLTAVRDGVETPQVAARRLGCDVDAIVTASRWLTRSGLTA